MWQCRSGWKSTFYFITVETHKFELYNIRISLIPLLLCSLSDCTIREISCYFNSRYYFTGKRRTITSRMVIGKHWGLCLTRTQCEIFLERELRRDLIFKEYLFIEIIVKPIIRKKIYRFKHRSWKSICWSGILATVVERLPMKFWGMEGNFDIHFCIEDYSVGFVG